jgi:hypothetical protein
MEMLLQVFISLVKQMSSIYKTTCRHFNEMLDFGLMTFFFFWPLRLEYTEAVLMVLDPVLIAIKLIFY